MTRHFLLQLLLLLSYASTLTVSARDCGDQKDAYANCVFRMDPTQGKACDDCRIETFDYLPERTECGVLQSTLCQAVHSCDCGDCKDELEAFWQCTTSTDTNNGTCGIDCFTEYSETPTGPLCPSEFNLYKECVFGLGTDRDACDQCRLDASATIPADEADCETVQEIFCQAVKTCPCSTCDASLELYLDCDVYKRWFGECSIDCGVASAAASDGTVGDRASGGEETSSATARVGVALVVSATVLNALPLVVVMMMMMMMMIAV